MVFTGHCILSNFFLHEHLYLRCTILNLVGLHLSTLMCD